MLIIMKARNSRLNSIDDILVGNFDKKKYKVKLDRRNAR